MTISVECLGETTDCAIVPVYRNNFVVGEELLENLEPKDNLLRYYNVAYSL